MPPSYSRLSRRGCSSRAACSRFTTASAAAALLFHGVDAQLLVDFQNLAETSEDVGKIVESHYKNDPEAKKLVASGALSAKEESASESQVVHETILKEGIKECDPSVKQHSGYIAFKGNGDSEKSYFFWLFESKKDPANAPLVLWLTGGPGCSSIMALLSENGPCGVEEDGKTLKPNPHSWNNNANVIWVDQPAGTGFSEGSYDHNESGVAIDMYGFLTGLLEKFPQYQKLPFYITGESYAGHYIPAVGHKIWEMNKQSPKTKINLKGLAIGNGMTDPEEQYKHYPEMGFDGGKSQGGSLEKGVITNPVTQAIMRGGVGPCVKAIQSCNAGSTAGCMGAFLVCNYAETVPYQLTGMNVYDMRIKCAVPPLCYDFSQVTTFLNDDAVKKQLGARGKWASCNMVVNAYFRADFMMNFHLLLPEMMADGIDVLIYAGDVDYICNWLGNKAWALKLDWPGKADFNAAEDAAYMVGGKQVGRLRKAGKFSFLQVYEAGHMVPMDQPEAALGMLNDFIGVKSGAGVVTGSAKSGGVPKMAKLPFSLRGKSAMANVRSSQDEAQEVYN
mmetsp:Transcript_784/g.1650  ORF Transcript_784/g.1650 Transcript_784/m.1650 type:complete len:561 (-) Transcript_784:585-2267(-)|eukprot:CAMPEP_0178997726 /NCGR_PEP_ID=MMETSP0795-20121207/9116_1 /TAXON_ID=88552 /ORGANISM="Amoebophrya sp., Strain Ameob2" /LENGTH=560 /DNA_ID=CAMNT_0020690323 /DNA_START=288 /DNA_END=1970 /DNA_ORIENTATION=+